MARMNPTEEFNEIRRRAILSNNELLNRSANVGFRDLLDPYCAEWHDNTLEEKLEIIQLLDTIQVSLVALCEAFQETFRRADREDVAEACGDALKILLESST